MKKLARKMGLALLLSGASLSWAAEPLQRTTAQLSTLPAEVVVDALIEAVFQTTVSAQTSGRITEVMVDVDDYVNKGDVILRLRDKEQRAALKAAEARAEEAKAAFTRMQELLQKKLVSQAEYDKAQAGLHPRNKV